MRIFSTAALVIAAAMGSPEGAATSAWAQDGTAKSLFEKHNLLGTFAWDCSRAVGRDNYYYVHRVLDAQHVQRDMMSGPTSREFVVIWERGTELRPNTISLFGTRDGEPVESIYRVEPGRVRVMESTAGGRKEISDGRFSNSGRETPWMNKCPGR
jgi:hypothetical protein